MTPMIHGSQSDFTILPYHDLEIGGTGDQDYGDIVMPAARVGELDQRSRGFLYICSRTNRFKDFIVPDQIGETVTA